MSRRAAFSLPEVLFAGAIMAAVLLGAYGSLQDGFRAAANSSQRERAEAVARGLLAQARDLPEARLVALGRGEGPLGPDGLPEEWGAGDHPGLTPQLEVRDLGGGRVSLRAEVSWAGPSGAARSVKHAQVVRARDDGAATLRQHAGLGGPDEVAGFGSRRDWPTHHSRRATSTSQEANAELLARVVARAGQAAARGGEAAAPGALAFVDPRGLAAEVLGEGGRLASQLEARRAQRAAAAPAQAEAQLLARAGLAALPATGSKVPDGTYPFRVEAADLREDPTRPRRVELFHLFAAARTWYLLGESFPGGARPRTLEGDPVLEVQHLVDAEGTPHRLDRTEARLYLATLGPDVQRHRLRLQTLDQPDASEGGERWTREAIEGLAEELGLAPPPEGDVPPPSPSAGLPIPPRIGAVSGFRVRKVPVEVRVPASGEAAEGDPGAEGEGDAEGALATPDSFDRARLWNRVEGLVDDDPAGALEALEEYRQHFPDEARAWTLTGRLRRAQGEKDAAIEAWTQAVRAGEEDREVRLGLAEMLVKESRLVEAADLLQALVDEDPADRLAASYLRGVEAERRRLGR